MNSPRKPHSPGWYDRLAQMQRGYYYPWQSTLAPFNGEEAYLDRVRAHLALDKAVLDVACGHGEVALDIASQCRSVLAYDRVLAFIELAQQAQAQRGIRNVTFLCADSSPQANGGHAHIPAKDHTFDLLISRRGPLHWIEDAQRVATPGAVLIQLNPIETAPAWNNALPAAFRFPEHDAAAMQRSVEGRLSEKGLRLHSCWTFDVPETFASPEQFYVHRAWGHAADEVPTFAEVRSNFERLFRDHAGAQGLEVRHQRFLWKSVVENG